MTQGPDGPADRYKDQPTQGRFRHTESQTRRDPNATETPQRLPHIFNQALMRYLGTASEGAHDAGYGRGNL